LLQGSHHPALLAGETGHEDRVALLIVGLILFIGMHVLPSSARLRAALATRLGESGYRILFSLVSVAGLILIAIGYGQAPREQIFEPSQTARTFLPAAMAVAFVLVAVANVPGRIRRLLRHPMLAGVLIWSVLHLLANGDLASNLLFGAFALWSVFAILSAEYRGKRPAVADGKPGNPAFDLLGAIVGLIAFWMLLHFHAALFGSAPV
jgi:uncharacterized membrane protein